MSDNIIHMVLARLPDAPQGNKGISLFLVPKYYDDEKGNRIKNDIKVVSIEHKLGHTASPTCVLSFGENNECVGELIGEPHNGLKSYVYYDEQCKIKCRYSRCCNSRESLSESLIFF